MGCLAPSRFRAHKLLAEIQSGALELAPCPIVAFHGDFSYRNMLVNEDATPRTRPFWRKLPPTCTGCCPILGYESLPETYSTESSSISYAMVVRWGGEL